jgi:hypothetical protein
MSYCPCAVANPTVSVLRLSHYTNTTGDCLSNDQDALSDSLWLAIPMRVSCWLVVPLFHLRVPTRLLI